MAVRFVNKDGSAATIGSDGVGYRHLDLIIVTGKLVEAEDGSKRLEATGFHRVERPEFDHDVKWPDLTK